MAEYNSLQMTKVLATPPSKLVPSERHGRRRIMFGQITAAAAAVGDTVFLGRIPAGARISGVRLNNAVGTAASTLNIGMRSAFANTVSGVTTPAKTVISANGLASAASIATAANTDVSASGTLINAGQSYITPYEVDVYGTIQGAATPAAQLMSVSVDYITD